MCFVLRWIHGVHRGFPSVVTRLLPPSRSVGTRGTLTCFHTWSEMLAEWMVLFEGNTEATHEGAAHWKMPLFAVQNRRCVDTCTRICGHPVTLLWPTPLLCPCDCIASQWRLVTPETGGRGGRSPLLHGSMRAWRGGGTAGGTPPTAGKGEPEKSDERSVPPRSTGDGVQGGSTVRPGTMESASLLAGNVQRLQFLRKKTGFDLGVSSGLWGGRAPEI